MPEINHHLDRAEIFIDLKNGITLHYPRVYSRHVMNWLTDFLERHIEAKGEWVEPYIFDTSRMRHFHGDNFKPVKFNKRLERDDIITISHKTLLKDLASNAIRFSVLSRFHLPVTLPTSYSKKFEFFYGDDACAIPHYDTLDWERAIKKFHKEHNTLPPEKDFCPYNYCTHKQDRQLNEYIYKVMTGKTLCGHLLKDVASFTFSIY